jgi:hypothetical protein
LLHILSFRPAFVPVYGRTGPIMITLRGMPMYPPNG